eukprot:TRINITY_DN22828_c0_g1_i1.p1 TRINITY_DN22828_c0_g1~~TRINITY_DN22828_c0_g1_i1.p1  ORF type:complete len:362 (+),score=85.66 TRINITY_DN22828_c0_g1_i1:84-1169(+)
MRRVCIGAAAVLGVAAATDVSFEAFIEKHGRSYTPEEYEARRAIFEANRQKVLTHNMEYEAGKHSWYMSLNHLADMTDAEFLKLRGRRNGESWGASPPPTLQLQAMAPAANPESIDWRTKGVVTAVKNQGGCGSCWAFAATETMESHLAIATGSLVELAPQAYVNCVQNLQKCGGTGGCEGATEELAFNTSKDLGLPLESDLPYEGQDGKCSTYKAAAKNQGYVKLPTNDAGALETALATKGPIAITVAANQWMLYGGGVFSGCTGKEGAILDHGVQAVGYTKDYWIVRNSWGPGWGEKGYIYISRAKDSETAEDTSPADGVACAPVPKSQTVGGECGILSDSSYPTGMSRGALDNEAVVV